MRKIFFISLFSDIRKGSGKNGYEIYSVCDIFIAWYGTDCNVFQFDAGKIYVKIYEIVEFRQ